MNGLFAVEYWQAAEKEISTLEGMDGTLVFKCKQFPNGKMKKFKTYFCGCGDQ